MTCRPLLLAALVAIPLAGGPLMAQELAPAVPEGPWLRIETQGFILLGNVPEERLRSVASDLEHLRHVFLRLAGGDAVTLEGQAPTFVYALEGKSSIFPIPGGGFFLPRKHRNYAVVHAHPGVHPTTVLFREYIHQLLHTTEIPYPLWLRQGLVELFGTASISDFGATGRIRVLIGRQPEFAVPVQASDFRPLEWFFALEEIPHLESPEGSLFRYQTWALVHYLLLGNDLAARRLPDFVERLRAGVTPEAAFRTTLAPVLPEDLRGALKSYLTSYPTAGRLPILRFDLGEQPELRLEARPMERPEVLFHLGDLLLEAAEQHQHKARRFLQEAVELAPEHGGAHLDLARLARRAGETQTALHHAERALPHLPADAISQRGQAHQVLGSALLDSLDRRRPQSETDRERLERARIALREATGLLPDEPQPWVELTVGYGLEPEPLPEELEVVEEALERFPDRPELVANAVLAYGRRRDRETAEELYQRLVEMNADEATLARAREVLFRLAFFEADRLISQGRHQDAVGIFAEIQAGTRDPRLHRQVTERIALLKRAEEYNRFIDLLLECQERIANDDLDGATTQLAELRDMAHPGKQTEVVEALARRLEQRQAASER